MTTPLLNKSYGRIYGTILAQTNKAVLICITDPTGAEYCNDTKEIWMPVSQMSYISNPDLMNGNAIVEFHIPIWLLDKNDLDYDVDTVGEAVKPQGIS